MKKKKWQKFESLVLQVQKKISPEAEVKQDQRIPGKKSKRFRQIDIVIRKKIGQYNILIIMDCKDYRRNLNVKDIETFIGLVEDVGANKGALVSATGFSQTAKNRAIDAGVDLYRLVDTGDHEWQAYVTIPTVFQIKKLISYRFRLVFPSPGPLEIHEQDIRNLQRLKIYDKNHHLLGTILFLLTQKWNKDFRLLEPGEYKDLPINDGKAYIETDGSFYEVQIKSDITSAVEYYFGQMPLEEISGFHDEINKIITTKEIRSISFNPEDIERNWKRIPSTESLAVEPVVNIKLSHGYQLVESGLIPQSLITTPGSLG